jgi:hypothetical protein
MSTIKQKAIAVLVACMLFVCASAAQAQSFIDESFAGTTAPDWVFVNAAGEGPFLTASDGTDRNGRGWLRLTSDEEYQNSFVYYNNPITTNYGFVLEFDFVMWTSNSTSADGICVVLSDGTVQPDAGGWGGSLGYAQHEGYGSIGMNGGFTAFAFDAYGNFSNPTEDREGGPGFYPHSVVLRGSQGADRSQGYEYLTGALTTTTFSRTNTSRRPNRSGIYNVRLTMTPAGVVTIEMKADNSPTWNVLVDQYASPLVYPAQVRIGFTGSTGGLSAVQELRNFVVTPVEQPECWDDSDCPGTEVCFGYICEEPTLIELGSMDASWEEEGINVSWITDTEIDNAYFNVYRAESVKAAKTEKKNFLKKLPKWLKKKKSLKKGPFVKINAAPIPALGETPYGAFYELIDTDVEYGKRYWYKLEDVDLYGMSTQHGPCGPVSAWEDCSYTP